MSKSIHKQFLNKFINLMKKNIDNRYFSPRISVLDEIHYMKIITGTHIRHNLSDDNSCYKNNIIKTIYKISFNLQKYFNLIIKSPSNDVYYLNKLYYKIFKFLKINKECIHFIKIKEYIKKNKKNLNKNKTPDTIIDISKYKSITV